MGTPLNALIVEDVELDALLLVRELKRGGFDVTFERVETAEAMRDALEHRRWDVVLSDYSMPHFGALQALELVKGRGLDLPFIIVSGTIGEDAAVQALHAGAHDFMAKHKLGRLVPAIERELRDVALRTEQKRMEEQLTISDRMASMGMLAAGVAHEINNPLASVMANLDLAATDLVAVIERHGLEAELQDLKEELDDARGAVERIRHITRDLKIFSRGDDEKTSPVDIVRVIDSSLRMAWNEVRHRARLVKRYDSVPAVQASESRLGQVFLNLIVNAAQAIPEGHADRNELRVTVSTDPRGHIAVVVSDTGTGMPPEVLGRLFTPFFTTKPIGVGTGLGLSICHRIVTGLGGSIEVSSQVGAGTSFTVRLPPARAAATSPPPAQQPAHSASRRGRVLVVDDDRMVVTAIQRILGGEHEVVGLESAALALQRVAGGECFDLVLCDLMMPEMTGMDLHAALSRVRPDHVPRIVFLTAGAFTPAARQFLDEVTNDRLDKPFDTAALRAFVNARIS